MNAFIIENKLFKSCIKEPCWYIGTLTMQYKIIKPLRGMFVAEERQSELELEIRCATNKICMKEEWIKDSNKRLKQLQSGKIFIYPLVN